jgi:hypothetical protein
LIEVLAAAEVQFVIVGGIAAAMHGIPNETPDLDILCPRGAANDRLLLRALSSLGARLKGAVETAPPLSSALLQERIVTFSTDAGELDVVFEATGGFTFEDLKPSAIEVKVGDARVRLVSAAHLAAMKRATNRPKDQQTLRRLEGLEALDSADASPLPADPSTPQINPDDWVRGSPPPRPPRP